MTIDYPSWGTKQAILFKGCSTPIFFVPRGTVGDKARQNREARSIQEIFVPTIVPPGTEDPFWGTFTRSHPKLFKPSFTFVPTIVPEYVTWGQFWGQTDGHSCEGIVVGVLMTLQILHRYT